MPTPDFRFDWMWNYNRLTPAQQAWSDAIAAASEDDFYVWAKYICGLDRLVPRIHEPLCRFMASPVLNGYPGDASMYEIDWVESDKPIERGLMKAGDIFGGPYNRETRQSKVPRKRQLVRVPRGCYKTSLVAAMVLWTLHRDVNKSAMIMGVDDNASNKILAFCDRHIRSNPMMAYYWGIDKWIGDDPWTVTSKFISTRTITRANDPSIWSTSPGSVKAGPHPDLVWVDDILNDKIMNSDELVAKVNDAYDSLSPMLTKDSIVWVTGTPWGKYDFYETLARRRAGTHPMFDLYTRDAVNPDGTLWFPELLSDDFLTSKYIEAKESGKLWQFWSQYRMQPVSEIEQNLAVDEIRWVMQDEVDKLYPSLRKVGGVDPADEQTGSGYWALCAFGTDADKHFWDKDAHKIRGKTDMVTEIVNFIVRHNLEVFVVENTVISRRLITDLREKLFEKGVRCAVVEVEPHSRNKIDRIRELENGLGSVMAQKRLHLRDANQPVKNELRTFPGGDYTYDLLDIYSYVMNWVAANGFYPRRPEESPKRSELPDEMRDAYRMAEQALEERDRPQRVMLGHNIFASV